MNMGFLENCLIQSLREGPKGISDLAEAINFDKRHIAFSLSRLLDDGIIEAEPKIIKEPTNNSSGSGKWIYKLTPIWQDIYSL